MGVGGISETPRGMTPERQPTQITIGKDPVATMVSSVGKKPANSVSTPRVLPDMLNPAPSLDLTKMLVASVSLDKTRPARQTAEWVVGTLPSMDKRELMETLVAEVKTLPQEQQRAFWHGMATFILNSRPNDEIPDEEILALAKELEQLAKEGRFDELEMRMPTPAQLASFMQAMVSNPSMLKEYDRQVLQGPQHKRGDE